MADVQPRTFQLGDRVKILNSTLTGRIVELRGPLGPKGALVYGVRVGSQRPRAYIEVLGEQLEVIRPKADVR